MGYNPYQTGAGGGLDPGYTGQDKMSYDAGRDQRYFDQKKRQEEEARMRAKAFHTGEPPAKLGGSGDGRASDASGDQTGGLLGIIALVSMLGILLVGLATVPLVFAITLFAWPVPWIMRRTVCRGWRIGLWRSWLAMFLALWAMITVGVLVGGPCWYYTVATYRALPAMLQALVLPLGGIVEMIRFNLGEGALPWAGLSRIGAGQCAIAAATIGLPMLGAFAAMLMLFERPTFNGVAGFGRAVAVGFVALVIGVTALSAALALLGFTVVQIYG